MTDQNRVDVVIVGSGPTGAVAAKKLVASGMSVICLEQGDYADYTLMRHEHPDFEISKDHHFAANPNIRKSPSDFPIDDTASDVSPLMWNGVGGSSMLYAAAWHRFRPSDFRVRTLDGVGEDWPFTYEDLAPFYDQVEQDFAVSGVGGDPAYPEHDIPLPPFPQSELTRRFASAHQRLGWHWWPGSNSIATVKTNGLMPCVRRGACMWGCFDGAKASVDRTHWPEAVKSGVQLKTGCRVVSIETTPEGKADAVVYQDRNTGGMHRQQADMILVCSNGLGTPRLLLNSQGRGGEDGIANRSGQVGKNLMMHPYGSVVGFFEEFFETWQGPYGQRAYSMEFAETRRDTGFHRGAKWQLMGTGGPLSVTGRFPWGDSVIWGDAFHKNVRKRFGRTAFWAIIAEDLPDPENTVVLDRDNLDSSGMPGVKIRYKTSENSLKLMNYNLEKAKESMIEAGAYETHIAPQLRDTGWHMLGTARMGNDPETSVVNGYGQAHDIPNLFILDGSVMPTSGPVNPTGTVAAIALRSAGYIAENRRNL